MDPLGGHSAIPEARHILDLGRHQAFDNIFNQFLRKLPIGKLIE